MDEKTQLPGEDEVKVTSQKGAKIDNEEEADVTSANYANLQDRINSETDELAIAMKSIFTKNNAGSRNLIQKALDKTVELARKGSIVARAQIANINEKFKDQGVVIKIDENNVATKAFAGCQHCVQFIDLFIPDCSDYSEIRDLVSYERVSSLDAPVFYKKLKDFSPVFYTTTEATEQKMTDVLDECIKGELYPLFTSLEMTQKELHTCSNVDKVLTHIQKMKKNINKATLSNVLYTQKSPNNVLPQWDGIWDAPSTRDFGTTTFDDVDFLDALANGLMKLVEASECDITNFTILVHPSVHMKMMNMRDSENRLLFAENGVCTDPRFNCVRIEKSFLMKNVVSTENPALNISDVIIGDFSHYSLLELQIPFVDDYMTDQMLLKMMYKGFATGKIVGESFGKLQVTYANLNPVE
jgi:hypothetical protein